MSKRALVRSAVVVGLVTAAVVGGGQVASAAPSHRPYGSFDEIGRVTAIDDGSSLEELRGWAIDPDVVDPVQVHVYLDGAFIGATTADEPRPDVAAKYPAYGADHGFDVALTRPATPGTHTICAYALNVGAGSNTLLGCKKLVVALVDSDPFGVIDALDITPSTTGDPQLTFTGWTIDPDTNASINVVVAVDGVVAATSSANLARPDVGAAYPGSGSAHGFTISVTAPITNGTHKLCIIAVNVGLGTAGTQLGCATYVLNLAEFNPIGVLDSVALGPDGVTDVLTGWAIDPDTVDPIDVHAYVDGVFSAAATANLPRPDIAAVFPVAGPLHGYAITVPRPTSNGIHYLCTYAINVGLGTENPVIGCKTLTI